MAHSKISVSQNAKLWNIFEKRMGLKCHRNVNDGASTYNNAPFMYAPLIRELSLLPRNLNNFLRA